MTYDQALAFLDSLTNFERTHQPDAMRAVPLDRMQRLCRHLGDPQRRFRSVVVTGTNGKGSICAMLYAMLRRGSLRVGLYTSPHLEDVRERIRVSADGDDQITPEEFAAGVGELAPAVEAMRREGGEAAPTWFEAMTALAFLHFAHRRVAIAVLEAGLGGRLDATNVVEQAVSVLAPIDVDHTDILGRDRGAIAVEKVGVIKPNQTVIAAPQAEEASRVIRERCERHGTPLLVGGEAFTPPPEGAGFTMAVHRHDLEGIRLTVTGRRGTYDDLALPLLGRHQAMNAAVAIAAMETLSPSGRPHALVEGGLAQVAWPGRIERVHDAPLVIMDGAHNPHAAAALCEALRELCPARALHVLLGMSADKQVEAVGRLLGGVAVSVTCTKSRHPRALDPLALAQRVRPVCPDVYVMSDPLDAYTYLLNAVSPSDVIVVTGSLFLVGELRAALRRAQARNRDDVPQAAAV